MFLGCFPLIKVCFIIFLIVIHNFIVYYFVVKYFLLSLQKAIKIAMQEIAKIIKTEREKRGLTKYKLAMMSGVTQSHIQQIESGLDCRVSTLKKVLESLNLMLSIHGMPQPIKK